MNLPAKKCNTVCSVTRRPDNKVVPLKAGAFGGQGSGKTYTFAMLALGISIHLHDRAPVFVFDTEPGWQFLKKQFAIEGVPLIQRPGEGFDELRNARKQAEGHGACVFVGDSYTHIWNDLMKSFMSDGGYIEFQDWNSIKPLWREWIHEFMNTPMHCMALGRLGWNYTPEVDERRGGKIKMVKSDSKFNAGGGESFGYEPNLLVEMEVGRQGGKGGRGGQFVYLANVLKDRAQVLNGMQFTFDCARGYQQGDYLHVWNAFAPHIQELQTLDSQVLLPAGTDQSAKQHDSSNWSKARQQKTVTLESIENTIVLLWPGQKAEDKRIKLQVVEQIFGVRSWSAVEAKPLKELEAGLFVLYALEQRLKTEVPSDETQLSELIRLSRQDVENPLAEKKTALSVQLEQSIAAARNRTIRGVTA